MAAPQFDTVKINNTAHGTLYIWETDSNSLGITELRIQCGAILKQISLHFASPQNAFDFCINNSFVPDFHWLGFVTFEGATIPKISEFVLPKFKSEEQKQIFQIQSKGLTA